MSSGSFWKCCDLSKELGKCSFPVWLRCRKNWNWMDFSKFRKGWHTHSYFRSALSTTKELWIFNQQSFWNLISMIPLLLLMSVLFLNELNCFQMILWCFRRWPQQELFMGSKFPWKWRYKFKKVLTRLPGGPYIAPAFNRFTHPRVQLAFNQFVAPCPLLLPDLLLGGHNWVLTDRMSPRGNHRPKAFREHVHIIEMTFCLHPTGVFSYFVVVFSFFPVTSSRNVPSNVLFSPICHHQSAFRNGPPICPRALSDSRKIMRNAWGEEPEKLGGGCQIVTYYSSGSREQNSLDSITWRGPEQQKGSLFVFGLVWILDVRQMNGTKRD